MKVAVIKRSFQEAEAKYMPTGLSLVTEPAVDHVAAAIDSLMKKINEEKGLVGAVELSRLDIEGDLKAFAKSELGDDVALRAFKPHEPLARGGIVNRIHTDAFGRDLWLVPTSDKARRHTQIEKLFAAFGSTRDLSGMCATIEDGGFRHTCYYVVARSGDAVRIRIKTAV